MLAGLVGQTIVSPSAANGRAAKELRPTRRRAGNLCLADVSNADATRELHQPLTFPLQGQ